MVWPGVDTKIRLEMWVEFVGSLLYTERFPLSSKDHHLTCFVLIVNLSLQCPQLVLRPALEQLDI